MKDTMTPQYLLIVLTIIVIHWFADFVLPTHWQATNKSTNNKALLLHVLSYSTVWLVVGSLYSVTTDNAWTGVYFAMITFVFHTLTDYFTSRLNSKLWAKGDVHNFFVSIGFDQVLHYCQLFLTYYILTT